MLRRHRDEWLATVEEAQARGIFIFGADDQQMLSWQRLPAEPNRRRIVNLDEGGEPAINGSNPPLWECPVRWPADGLPFDMRALRYVLAAAEQMSFSGAASALGVTVSSISRHVRDFEDDLGISLFERTSTGVRLTRQRVPR